MKYINDYHKAYDELGLFTAHERVYNRVSRVKRSLQRMKQFIDVPAVRNTLKQYYKIKVQDGMTRIRCKNLLALDFMVDKIVAIYNGKKYVSVKIKEQMLGRYLKEFVATRNEERKRANV